MNDRCEEIRERIEDSIGREQGADEKTALDLHCSTCKACAEYRERLIGDHLRLKRLAERLSQSELRAEERSIAMLPAETPAGGRRPRFRGILAGSGWLIRVAAAAAVIVAVIIGVDLLSGRPNGPVPAFASVLEKMEGANNVVEQVRRWSLGRWTTETRAQSKAGISRREDARGILIFSSDRHLSLYPAEKRAVITNMGGKSPNRRGAPESNLVDRIASWHKRKEFSLVRRERYMGKNAAAYESRTGKNYRRVTWVDIDTGLPFRIEIYNPDFTNSSRSYSYGLKLSDFLPADSVRSAAAGWTVLRPDEPAMIEDLTWNVSLDTSYFSLTPPAGYAVTESDSGIGFFIMPATEQGRERIPFAVSEIKQAFSVWLSLSGGMFPDNVYELGDSSKARPLLMARHRKGESSGDEFRTAIMDAGTLDRGFGILRSYDEAGTLHYAGTGVTFGDSTKVVCWAELFGWERKLYKHPYWAIYADLHAKQFMTPPKIR
jgi:hypothetical protein